MTTGPSIVKRAYDGLALFALLNMVGVGALVVYLVAGGVLNGEKGRRIVGIMRDEDLSSADEAASKEPVDAETDDARAAAGTDAVVESQVDVEIIRRESERIKAELDQRLALNNSILLRVVTERERFQRELEEATNRQEASSKQRREKGFRKQIAIYESLSPKVAIQHLLALTEPDDAARILLEMETRKAKKVIEVAKRGEQIEKMKQILKRVREVAPDRSAELDSEEP